MSSSPKKIKYNGDDYDGVTVVEQESVDHVDVQNQQRAKDVIMVARQHELLAKQ